MFWLILKIINKNLLLQCEQGTNGTFKHRFSSTHAKIHFIINIIECKKGIKVGVLLDYNWNIFGNYNFLANKAILDAQLKNN